MRILILDDESSRHILFRLIYETHSVVHTETYCEFVNELLSGLPWDLIHLDHDLGSVDSYIDGWGETQFFTGLHAADRICELSDDLLPSEVIVHSMNPIGAKIIVDSLTLRGIKTSWQPFEMISFDKDE